MEVQCSMQMEKPQNGNFSEYISEYIMKHIVTAKRPIYGLKAFDLPVWKLRNFQKMWIYFTEVSRCHCMKHAHVQDMINAKLISYEDRSGQLKILKIRHLPL